MYEPGRVTLLKKNGNGPKNHLGVLFTSETPGVLKVQKVTF